MSSKSKKKKKEDGKPIDYAHSEAKYYLQHDLLTGAIPLNWREMSYQEAYKLRPEFAQFNGATKFQQRLQRSRARAKTNKNRSMQEMAALTEDRKKFPKQPTNFRGEQQWEGSQAQKFLIQDIKLGNHIGIKPRDFQLTRTAYQTFPLAVFRGHIYQEARYQKWVAHLHSKTKKKFNLK